MRSNYTYRYCMAMLLPFLWLGCEQPQQEQTHAVYGIQLWNDAQQECYWTAVPSLDSGRLAVTGKETVLNDMVVCRHGGYYYTLNTAESVFKRYKVNDRMLELSGELRLGRSRWKPYSAWYNLVDSSTLLLGSSMAGTRFVYSLIDLNTMQLKRFDTLPVPLPGPHRYYAGIAAQLRNNRLYLSWSMVKGDGVFQDRIGRDKQSAPEDTTYLAEISYPAMQVLQIEKDTRSVWPGGYNIWSNSSCNYNNQLYFLAQPGPRTTGSLPKAVSGVFRIDKDSSCFAADYFFQLADNRREEAYTLTPVGNDKAIVRIIATDSIASYADYWDKPVAFYYLVDLKLQTKQKLPLPACVFDFTQGVLADGPLVYLPADEGKNRTTIWIYNIQTQQLKKGLEIEGAVLHLQKL